MKEKVLDEVSVNLHFGSIISAGLASPSKQNVANPLDALVASHNSKVVILLPVLVDEHVLLLSIFGIGDEGEGKGRFVLV